MNAQDINDINYSKILMAFAVAFLFVIQGVNQMQHSETKRMIDTIEESVVPRSEIQKMYVPSNVVNKTTASLEEQIISLTTAIENLKLHTEYKGVKDGN